MLSTEELSKRIAESIEPIPDYTPIVTGRIGASLLLDRTGTTAAWHYDVYSKGWQPRSMLEPEMVVLLQVKLIILGIYWTGAKWDGTRWSHIEMDGHSCTRRWLAEDYPRAVVEAYALASGLAEEGEL